MNKRTILKAKDLLLEIGTEDDIEYTTFKMVKDKVVKEYVDEKGKAKSKSENKIEIGGLSGKPLTNRSTEVIRFLSEKSNKAFPIIGVGGIHSAQDALDKLEAGATLIQLYTGFIYEGPALVKAINKKILERL